MEWGPIASAFGDVAVIIVFGWLLGVSDGARRVRKMQKRLKNNEVALNRGLLRDNLALRARVKQLEPLVGFLRPAPRKEKVKP